MATSIISIAIAVAILWIAYRVLFINSNRLVFNRAFLIVALGFSLILPAAGVFIGRNMPQVNSYRESLFQGFMLDEVVITAEGVAISTPADNLTGEDSAVTTTPTPTQNFNIWHYIWILYLVGAIIAAAVFIFKLGKIIFIIINLTKNIIK